MYLCKKAAGLKVFHVRFLRLKEWKKSEKFWNQKLCYFHNDNKAL